MTKVELKAEDLCRLKGVFRHHVALHTDQDRLISDWLDAAISAGENAALSDHRPPVEGERQPFEDYPRLAGWIEKLACRRIDSFSHASWCAFLGEINAAIRDARTAAPPSPPVEALGVREMVERLREALKPFAWIGQWLFARDLPDDTPVVTITGLGKDVHLTRGMFKSAHSALSTAPLSLGGDADG